MTRPPRGFALLIVMAVAAAAIVAAVSVTRLAATSAQVAGREESALLAANAARAGLERATAYAMQISSASGGDFDLVLDPLDEADCTNMDAAGSDQPFDFTQIDSTNTILRPRFNDPGAAHVEWPAGSDTWWRMVPFGQGAYLVRFEDDGDDDCALSVAATHTTWTSNNPGAGTCYEGVNGPAGTPPGYGSATNPVRDMNRAIWAISVGIFPGTDPSAARYRITERRMVTDASAAVGDAFVLDALHAHSSGNVVLESDVASPRSNRFHLKDSSSWEICRAESADWDHDPAGTSTAAACGPLAYNEVTISSFSVPTVPAWNDWTWMDPSSQCNFYLRNYGGGGNPEGLWWWNTAGTFDSGSKQCSDVTDFTQIPMPESGNGPTDINDPKSCWLPIMASPDPTGMFDPCGFGQASSTAAGVTVIPPVAWAPTSGGAAPAFWIPTNAGASAATDDCNGYYSANLPATPALPNFNAVCGNGVTLPGRGTLGACNVSGCNGTEWAIRYDNGSLDAQWSFRPVSAGTHYIPNGLYIYEGNYYPATNGVQSSNWDGSEPPMITLLMNGSLEINSNDVLAFGSGGQPYGGSPTGLLPALPGVIAPSDDVDVDSNGQLHVWGGFYVRGRVDLNSNGELHVSGPVLVEDRIHVESSSTLEWRYPDAFFVTAGPPSSNVRMSFPLRF